MYAFLIEFLQFTPGDSILFSQIEYIEKENNLKLNLVKIIDILLTYSSLKMTINKKALFMITNDFSNSYSS